MLVPMLQHIFRGDQWLGSEKVEFPRPRAATQPFAKCLIKEGGGGDEALTSVTFCSSV